MNYSVSLGLGARLTTVFAAVLFVAVIGLNLFILPDEDIVWVNAIHWGTSLLLIGIFIYCYLRRVIGYEVDREQITIQRPVGQKHIPISDVEQVILPEKGSLRWTIRTFGNGGIFGYTGSFANSTYGSMTWYATRTDKTMLIVTKDKKKILLTPDDLQMADEIIRQQTRHSR